VSTPNSGQKPGAMTGIKLMIAMAGKVKKARYIGAFFYCVRHRNFTSLIMSLISIILTLAIVGVLLWLLNKYLPMDATVKKIINIVVIVILCLWLLRVFGIWEYLANVRI
jgi:hypothetical protein